MVLLLFVQFGPFVCVDFVFLFCNVVLSILSSFAVIWMRERSGSCCLVVVRVLCLFLMVLYVGNGMRSVFVAFPSHIHLLLDGYRSNFRIHPYFYP